MSLALMSLPLVFDPPFAALGDTAQLIAIAVAGVLGMGVIKLLDFLLKRDSNKEATQIVERAELDATTLRKEAALEAKEMALKEKQRLEGENNEIRNQLHERERQQIKLEDGLTQQKEQLEKQGKMVENNQRRLSEKLDDATRRQKELDDLLDLERQTMHKLSSLSPEEAEARLLERLEKELVKEQGAMIMKYEKQIAEKCDGKAKEMLITSLQRFAAAHTAESTTSTVDIPNDEMKGRIIGREGRNIRALEKATGVDVIIDDTPGVVIVSAFDPVRRETARIALGKLIADGRIHPSRIEELVAETDKEIEAEIRKAGEEAMQEAQVFGLHDRVIELLGRLRYRTSYSQNVLRHSIEVSFIASMLAEELGLDGELARRAGLLHDIGKAADHDLEGGHPKIGADLLKRFGEGPEVVHAALGHHDDIRPDIAVHRADRCGRCLQCLAPWGTPRNARPLHQADARAGNDRHQFFWRPSGVCHPSRTRSPCHRQRERHDRRILRKNLPRHRQSVRAATDIPRRNQSHLNPRNTGY